MWGFRVPNTTVSTCHRAKIVIGPFPNKNKKKLGMIRIQLITTNGL